MQLQSVASAMQNAGPWLPGPTQTKDSSGLDHVRACCASLLHRLDRTEAEAELTGPVALKEGSGTLQQAKKRGLLEDDARCFCGEQPQSWRHLLYVCRYMDACRQQFINCRGRGGREGHAALVPSGAPTT